ncbi:MAG: glycosyltransferase [Gammaproteobacteria bacterium]
MSLHPFSEMPSDKIPIVLLACRLIWQKGISEYVEAAKLVNSNGRKARFVLVGKSFPNRSGAVPEEQLEAWHRDGVIEWWGHRVDMPEIIAQASVVTLPTFYGEGLPKVLLEASAAGRPIVATDWPGCNDLIAHGVNGLLVKPRDSNDLAAAINALLGDKTLCKRLAVEARKVVESGYTTDKVLKTTVDSYKALGLSASGS